MSNIKIGITHGDVNGISYELIINTFSNNKITELFTPILYGSAKAIAYHRKTLDIQNFSANKINSVNSASNNKLNLIDVIGDDLKIELGQSGESAGEASLKALKAVVEDLKNNQLDAVVTCPIDKSSVNAIDKSFTGHTGFLKNAFNANDVLMMMVHENLRIGVVTEHIPVSKVNENLSAETIKRKLSIFNNSLIKDFSIRKPKIAVLGLNPHAGDKGVIGNEDDEIIKPIIEELTEKGLIVMGPYAADGFFGSENYTKFDGILAMYHDQGLIPFKTLSKGQGVNYTAGLPIVRTSPAHGTAFELAGKGQADTDSFRNALYMAVDIVKSRKLNK